MISPSSSDSNIPLFLTSADSSIDALVLSQNYENIKADVLEANQKTISDLEDKLIDLEQENSKLNFEYTFRLNSNKERRISLNNKKQQLEKRQAVVNLKKPEYQQAEKDYKMIQNTFNGTVTSIILIREQLEQALNKLNMTLSQISISTGMTMNDDDSSSSSFSLDGNSSDDLNDNFNKDAFSNQLRLIHQIQQLSVSILHRKAFNHKSAIQVATRIVDNKKIEVDQIISLNTVDTLTPYITKLEEQSKKLHDIINKPIPAEPSKSRLDVIETIERSVIEAHSLLSHSDFNKIELSVRDEYAAMLSLVNENKARSANIERRKQFLHQSSSSQLSRSASPVRSISEIRKAMIPNPDTVRASPKKSPVKIPLSKGNHKKNVHVGGFLPNELKSRQQKLIKELEELDKYYSNQKKENIKKSEEYQQKLEKIKELQAEFSNRTELLMQIENEQVKNDALSVQLQSLEFEILKKKAENHREESRRMRIQKERENIETQQKKIEEARKALSDFFPDERGIKLKQLEIETKKGKLRAQRELVDDLQSKYDKKLKEETELQNELAKVGLLITKTLSEIEENLKRVNFVHLGKEELALLA